MEKTQKMRMKPKTGAGPEVLVPGIPKGVGKVLMWIPWKKRRISLVNLSDVKHGCYGNG
jgi:hypothetical protein